MRVSLWHLPHRCSFDCQKYDFPRHRQCSQTADHDEDWERVVEARIIEVIHGILVRANEQDAAADKPKGCDNLSDLVNLPAELLSGNLPR